MDEILRGRTEDNIFDGLLNFYVYREIQLKLVKYLGLSAASNDSAV